MQACHASADIRSAAARRVARPVLLFSGGQDTIVLNGAQAEFCDQVNASHPGRCEPWLLPESRHALLVEKDASRNSALDRMLRFFDDAAGRQSR